MCERALSRAEARQLYNAIGVGLDRAQRFEANAKQQALLLLKLASGQRVLHVGVGTGLEHAALVAAVAPSGLVVGCDLARELLLLTRRRVATPLCEADAIRLPIATASVDRLFSAYMLDLLPTHELPLVLDEFRRVLKPDGRLVLVSLTEGIDRSSRLFVGGWKLLYRFNPHRLGGCRPLELGALLGRSGFDVERRVVVQRGFPSEVLVGT